MPSTPETRMRRMDQALASVERLWDRYYRVRCEFGGAWERMTPAERACWAGEHGFELDPLDDYAVGELFRDLGA